MTDSNGIIETSFLVPQANVRPHRVIASDANGLTAEKVFRVQEPPRISVVPNHERGNRTVEFHGIDFTANSTIRFQFIQGIGPAAFVFDVPLNLPDKTGPNGALDTSFQVPVGVPTVIYTVKATDVMGLFAQSSFTIDSELQPVGKTSRSKR